MGGGRALVAAAAVAAAVAATATGTAGNAHGFGEERVPRGMAGSSAWDGARSELAWTAESYRDVAGMPGMRLAREPVVVRGGRALEVEVIWDEIKFSSPRDWVGVFPCDESAGPMGEEDCTPLYHYPTQFVEVPDKSAPRSVRFEVLVRPGVAGYRFAYVSPATLPYPEVQAVTSLMRVPPELMRRPMFVRLSKVSASEADASFSKMRFVWALAYSEVSDGELAKQRVRVGTTAGVWTHEGRVARVYDMAREDLCDRDTQPAATVGWVRCGLQAEAIVSGLEPGTRYAYEIPGLKGGASATGTFVTAPRLGQPTSMIVFGDMGQSMNVEDGAKQHSWDNGGRGEIAAPNTTRLVARLLEQAPEAISLVNHIGDISYATGALALWDVFMAQVEPITSRVPYMVAIGNHEMDYSASEVVGSDSQGECGRPYATYFPFAGQTYDLPLPGVRSAALAPERADIWREPYYSFDHGSAHVTVMSTEHAFDPASPQYAWIQRDLAAVDRKLTPWLLFMGHRPMYVSSPWKGDHDKLATTLQEHVGPLLSRFAVDVAFWGHHHSYQRTKLLDGVQHIVVGTGGFGLSQLAPGPNEDFAFLSNTTWGVSQLDLVNRTAARLRFWRSSDGAELDHVWLHRRDVHSAAAAQAVQRRLSHVRAGTRAAYRTNTPLVE